MALLESASILPPVASAYIIPGHPVFGGSIKEEEGAFRHPNGKVLKLCVTLSRCKG